MKPVGFHRKISGVEDVEIDFSIRLNDTEMDFIEHGSNSGLLRYDALVFSPL